MMMIYEEEKRLHMQRESMVTTNLPIKISLQTFLLLSSNYSSCISMRMTSNEIVREIRYIIIQQ